MRFIWFCLAGMAAVGLGYHIGRSYQRRAAKKSADEVHAAIAGLSNLAQALMDLKRMEGEIKGHGKAVPRNTDEALRDGNLAFFKPGDGSC